MSRKLKITIVSREAGQIIDEVLDDLITNIVQPHLQHKMQTEHDHVFEELKDKLEHKYNPSYDIHQAKCYQQYIPNFCGYHASFAYVSVLQILEKFQNPYNINSGASFWSFKRKIQNFLFKYREQKKLNKNQWPWKDTDIVVGDFQRTYNQLLKSHDHIFLDFATNQYFQLMEHTWQYQFKNLINDTKSQQKLGEKIDYFRQYSNSKPLVFVLMLAITNHWTCFIALKKKNEVQFWFIDSKNRDFLDFSSEQIAVFIHAMNEKRRQDKLEPWLPYQKQIFNQAMIDTQLSLRLIVKLLKGQQNIHRYSFNRIFEVFAEKYQEIMNWTGEIFTDALVIWSTEYKHNLRNFFGKAQAFQQLYQTNQITYKHMVTSIVKNSSKSKDLGIITNYIRSFKSNF